MPAGRPSKLNEFLKVAKSLDKKSRTDKELLNFVTKQNNNLTISTRTFQRWKANGLLIEININPEPIKKGESIRFKNQKQYQKDYYHQVKKNKIDFRLKNSFATLLRYHLKNKNSKTFNCVDYSIEELKNHLEDKFEEGMNWSNYGRNGWHIDHIIPASWFNYKTEKCLSFKKCWSLNNLQPKWGIDNMKKQNRYVG